MFGEHPADQQGRVVSVIHIIITIIYISINTISIVGIIT